MKEGEIKRKEQYFSVSLSSEKRSVVISGRIIV